MWYFFGVVFGIALANFIVCCGPALMQVLDRHPDDPVFISKRIRLTLLCHNLLAYFLNTLSMPFRFVVQMVWGFLCVFKYTRDLEEMAFPWEHNWNPFSEDFNA